MQIIRPPKRVRSKTAHHQTSGAETHGVTAGGQEADDAEAEAASVAPRRPQPSAHEHVANLLETHDGHFEMHAILHYCGGGSLGRLLRAQSKGVGLDASTVVAVGGQLADALAHVHACGVTHRDVKPDNVVFDDARRTSVRLVDFGLAAEHWPDGGSERRLRREHGACTDAADETQGHEFEQGRRHGR